MEPLMTAAIAATGAAVVTKLAENTGEKVGKALWDGTAKFMEILKQESPDTMMVIEQAPELPSDYGQAVLEVESAAKVNPQLAQAMQELAAAAAAEPHPKLAEVLEEIKGALKSPQPSIYNDNKAKLQEKGNINRAKFPRRYAF